MPTYEFRCPDGTIIERVFKMSEAPQTIPSPNGDGVAVRIISGGADLIFKGSGFYITDYGKDGKRDQREKSEKKESDKAAKAEKTEKAETKTDAKADSGSASKAESKAEKTAAPEKKAEPKSEPKAKPDSSSKGKAE